MCILNHCAVHAPRTVLETMVGVQERENYQYFKKVIQIVLLRSQGQESLFRTPPLGLSGVSPKPRVLKEPLGYIVEDTLGRGHLDGGHQVRQ